PNRSAVRARDQRPAIAAAPARVGNGRRDARLAHTRGIPKLHPSIESRVRRRQTHVRGDAVGLVQRSERVLSRIGAAGARPGHRVDRASAARGGSVTVLVAGRGDRRNRCHQSRLQPARAARRRDRARTLRCAGGSVAPACGCLLVTPKRRAVRRRAPKAHPLRIAHIAPVATTIPPPKSGSVELMTSLLTEGLVAAGHDVTLFATADSTTKAKLHATYAHGYWHDENMWPWELYEMLNLAAAVERAADFDIIHYEAAYYPMSLAFARLSPTPMLQTLHHSPSEAEIALWARYPEAPFVAISNEQAQLLRGLNVVDTV